MKRFFLRLGTRFSVYQFYWQLRSTLRRLRFRLSASGFRAQYSTVDLSTGVLIISSLFFTALGPIVRAALYVGCILAIPTFGSLLTQYVALPRPITALFENVDAASNSSYDGLLIGVITVIGIFLTLYFTSINTVAGTLYARVSQQIRDLLVQERVGNVYSRFLISLTIICLMLLAAGVVWELRPKSSILVIALFSCFAVVSFAKLARRVFLFFDPTLLADVVFGDLNRWSRQATISGYAWDDYSFQQYYHQRADTELKGIESLVAMAHEEPSLQREALATLLAKTATFLPNYLTRKHYIPSKSRWWGYVPHHKDWYLASPIEVGMAAQTRTSLQPELIPDMDWIEKRLCDLQLDAIRRCIADGRTSVMLRVLANQDAVFAALGYGWNVAYGEQFLTRLTTTVGAFLEQVPTTMDMNTIVEGRVAEQMQVVDYLGLFPIRLLLNLCKHAEQINTGKLTEAIEGLRWQRTDAVYRLSLPIQVVTRIEEVRRGVSFEQIAEGKVVSANWYLRMQIFQSLAEVLAEQVQLVLTIGSSYYLNTATYWLDNKKSLLAAELVSRGLEFYNKLIHHLSIIKKLVEDLETANIHTMLPWPTWDWEKIAEDINTAQKALAISLARCIPSLATTHESQELPDYLGHAVHLAGDESFATLVSNDPDTFANIFPLYFNGTLIMHDRLRKKTKDWPARNQLSASSAPLVDLAELSGYAKFYSELHQNPTLWTTCQTVWDSYFQREDSEALLETWVFILDGFRNMSLIPHRALLRQKWEMQVNAMLRSLPRKPFHINSYRLIEQYVEIIDHPSQLVRVMGSVYRDMIPSIYNGLDIFVTLYLQQRPEADKVEFENRPDLAEALERQQELDSTQQSDQAGKTNNELPDVGTDEETGEG
ncbi:MAG TPA: hypothetical protein VFZ66_27435 [Herpetosiphonaceae bacterium]